MTVPISGIGGGIDFSLLKDDVGAAGSASGGVAGVGGTDSAGGAKGFADMLKTKLQGVEASQQSSDVESQQLATGKSQDVAQSMLKIEQANVSLQLATQIRNKAIDAYQEILRMQI